MDVSVLKLSLILEIANLFHNSYKNELFFITELIMKLICLKYLD